MKFIAEYKSKSEADTAALAREIANRLKANDIVLLQGDLGSGKTFLVKAICKLWQTEEEAASPSFALVYQYGGRQPVNHVDLYRIENELELVNLGLGELFDNGAVTFVEWPQLIERHLDAYYKIEITMQQDGRLFRLLKKE
jgi:tRNA threonylcarbamoyl adenosine modification protein YjeE